MTGWCGSWSDGRQFSNEELKGVPYEKAVDMSYVRKARG